MNKIGFRGFFKSKLIFLLGLNEVLPNKRYFKWLETWDSWHKKLVKNWSFLQIRKRVQRTLMLLDALGIPFESIDITKPEKIDDRNFMKENAKKEGSTKPPLPPQFFYNDEYLGVKNLNEFFY